MHAHAGRTVRTAVLWGGLGVLAWSILTIFAGGGTAHADEGAPDPLDGLSGLVSDAVDAAANTVAPAADAVVAPVQDAAPVAQIASPP